MSKSKTKTRTNGYAPKRKVQGADSYGEWKNGEQQRADIIAGHVLTFRNARWSVMA